MILFYFKFFVKISVIFKDLFLKWLKLILPSTRAQWYKEMVVSSFQVS